MESELYLVTDNFGTKFVVESLDEFKEEYEEHQIAKFVIEKIDLSAGWWEI